MMANVRQPALRSGSFPSPLGRAAIAFAGAFWAVSLVEALSFLFMASLHVGARIPLGFTVVTDVRIVQATVAEAICGVLLLVASGALLAQRSWAWVFAAATQAFSVAVVLNGMTRVGPGPDSQLNETYHLVIVTLLALGFLALMLPPVHHAFRVGSADNQTNQM